jgi:hypothetical protein
MTIFTMKGGKIEPIAIIKGGKSMTVDEYLNMTAPMAAPAAEAPKPAAEPAKDAEKK